MNYARGLVFVILAIMWLSWPAKALATDSYMFAPSADIKNVGKQGHIEVAPCKLKAIFGPPIPELWDEESVGAYYFKSKDGEVFIVYYRAYDASPSTIASLRRTFWSEESTVELSIGAVRGSNVKLFKEWLITKLSGIE